MSRQRRPGTGGITPPGPTPDEQHRAMRQVAVWQRWTPAERLELLRILGLPTTRTHQPAAEPPTPAAPSPRPAAPPEGLPDHLTPRQAAAIARRHHRAGQRPPERVTRLLNHEHATRRTA